MKKLCVFISLILLASCLFSSCDALANGPLTKEDIFDGKTVKALYGQSVNKYKKHKDEGVPYSLNIVWTNEEENINLDVSYNGESIKYFISYSKNEENYNEEILFHDKTLYTKDKFGNKNKYKSNKNKVEDYLYGETHLKHIVPALPHHMPESWLNDLEFIPDGENGYTVEFNIDKKKSKDHPHYSDFYAEGASFKIYFTPEGVLDKIELTGVYPGGKIGNIVISFNWNFNADLGNFDDNGYTDKGEFNPDNVDPPIEGGNDNPPIDDDPSENKYSDGLEFEMIDEDHCVIIGIGTCTDINIVIPPKCPEGRTVVGIAPKCLSNLRNIESIHFPADFCCLGEMALINCSSLKSITVDEDNTAFKSIDGNLYSYDETVLIRYAIGKRDESFSIPESVITIGDDSFQGSPSITHMVIPDNVVTIGDYAFRGCRSLERLIIGDNVETIGVMAFHSCSLKSAVIGKNVKKIDQHAFLNCYALLQVINKSSLALCPGSEEYGHVAYYALAVNTETDLSINIDGYLFYSQDGVNYLFDYIGDDTELILPENYNGENYVIYDYAFDKQTLITSVVIPDSVTSIGHYAFKNCRLLRSVTIGENVVEIKYSAFGYCEKIVEVINKSSLDIIAKATDFGEIGENAIEVHEGDTKIVNQDGYLFYTYDGTNYLIGYSGNDTDLILPKNYNGQNYEIYQYAFYRFMDITSVTIPGSVTSIGRSAFESCRGLTSIKIPYGVKYIGNGAFYRCTELTSVELSNSVVTIDNYAFGSCNSITSIVIPDSVTSIGFSVFSGCSAIEDIVLPDGLMHVGSAAFRGTAYYENEDNWHNNVLYIGKVLVEARKENVSGVYEIKDGTVTIADRAFDSCVQLTEVVIPTSVKNIGNEAFIYCNIKRAVIPNSVTTIGYGAFRECAELTNVTLSSNITSIESFTFTGCYALENIVIPSGVTSIGNYAFSMCHTFTSIVIPESVTEIGSHAFSSCVNLITINIPENLNVINNGVFAGCGFTSIVIPEGVTSIGDEAFYSCSNLTSMIIPSSVLSIGKDCFPHSELLKDIYYTGSEEEWTSIAIETEGNHHLLSANIHYNYAISR